MVRLRSLLFSLALIALAAGTNRGTYTEVQQDILRQFTRASRPGHAVDENAEQEIVDVGIETVGGEHPSPEPQAHLGGAEGHASSASVSGSTMRPKPHKLPYDIDPKLLKDLLRFGRDEPFSAIIDMHSRLASELVKVFMNADTDVDIHNIVTKYINRINSGLFTYALSVALMHRNDTTHFPIDKLSMTNPSKLVNGRIIYKLQEAVNSAQEDVPISISRDYSTATNNDAEHRVAYFREDFGINLHHWHWHLVYPFDFDPKISKKDRRGELFYYMHTQVLARFNAERFSNDLGRVKRLNNFREPMTEGYFSKLDLQMASRSWPSRPAGILLRDIDRPDAGLKFDIGDLERWANRIYEAIYTGYVMNTKGQHVKLDEETGIDVLGNMIEASPFLSPNFDYYGSLHNRGHMAISYSHDPDGSYMEKFAVMGDSATAMRDPIFYRWHAFIDEIFMEYKKKLKPYPVNELNYTGIKVSKIEVIPKKGKVNHLETFWSQATIDLSRGLDFAPKSAVGAIFTHLNHTSFEYKIIATNDAPEAKKGVVRIFMAPRIDDRGLPFNLDEQRTLMIEMDKFHYKLLPGENIIKRLSVDSSVTIPFARNDRDLGLFDIPNVEQFCGCGWPQHMLVPKGTKDGLLMDLFVMISNDSQELAVRDTLTGSKVASTFCGVRDRKYPDARAMGFPFDRPMRKGVRTLAEFLTPNMAKAKIKVQFTDEIVKDAI